MAEQPEPTPTPPADEAETTASPPPRNLNAPFDGTPDNPTVDDDED